MANNLYCSLIPAAMLVFLPDVARSAEIVGVYVLPETPLSSVEPFIENDRGIALGGIGSDLWHGPTDPPNRFWMLTDRGPNGELKVDGRKRRTFPVPDFSPIILHVELAEGKIKVLRTVSLVDSAGQPVGGVSNLEEVDETPYDFKGRKQIDYDPNGLDTEGLVRTPQGDFWLAEEYSPSLLRCDANGKVLKRYVPQGVKFDGTRYPIAECLPSILARRQSNRGFEGLTLSRDGKTLYAAMQSPLSHPDRKTSNRSRNIRILAFDVVAERPTAEYVYQTEADARDAKISSLTMLNETSMLAMERSGGAAKLYRADLSGATNLLGSSSDDPAVVPSLESTTDLAAAHVTAMPKSLVLDLSRLPNVPDKIEGVAVVDPSTIAVANDNDFDLGEFDFDGRNQPRRVRSEVVVIRLDSPLPLSP